MTSYDVYVMRKQITADPQSDLRYTCGDEVLAFRYWSGRQWKPA